MSFREIVPKFYRAIYWRTTQYWKKISWENEIKILTSTKVNSVSFGLTKFWFEVLFTLYYLCYFVGGRHHIDFTSNKEYGQYGTSQFAGKFSSIAREATWVDELNPNLWKTTFSSHFSSSHLVVFDSGNGGQCSNIDNKTEKNNRPRFFSKSVTHLTLELCLFFKYFLPTWTG